MSAPEGKEQEARPETYSLECGHSVIPRGSHEIWHAEDGTRMVYCPNHEFSYRVIEPAKKPAEAP